MVCTILLVLGLFVISWLMGFGLSDHLYSPVRFKVECCRQQVVLTTLVAKIWTAQPWWYHLQATGGFVVREEVLPLCKGPVSIFYNPSWQGCAVGGYKMVCMLSTAFVWYCPLQKTLNVTLKFFFFNLKISFFNLKLIKYISVIKIGPECVHITGDIC